MNLRCICFLVISSLLQQCRAYPELDWWQKTVVYQIYPRSMLDTNGDGIGDIKGIEMKLNYLSDIGAKTFWISPIYKSPMKDFGYDISNYTDVDPVFGDLDDFKALIKSAEELGMHCVLDFVPNHSSDEHEWFQRSRRREGIYEDYYVWADGRGENNTEAPNNWISVFDGPAWTYDALRGQFYYHAFLDSQPDLNYSNPNVRREMLNAIKFWLDLGVDGFRVDAIKFLFEDAELRDEPASKIPGVKPGYYDYLDHIYTGNYPEVFAVVREWRDLLELYEKKDGEHRLMMVEDYSDLNITMQYYGNATHPLADFPFNFQLIKLNKNSTGFYVHDLVTSWLDAMPEGKWANWVLGNHDNHRIADRTDVQLVDALNAINLLLGGTPVTYYGEEIGMVDVFIPYNETQDPQGKKHGQDDYLKYSRDFERTPMQWTNASYAGFTTGERPWLRVADDYQTRNVEFERTATGCSHLNIYKRLVQLRTSNAVLYGDRFFPVISNAIFSFARVIASNSSEPGYVVAVNLGPKPESVDLVDSKCCDAFSFPPNGVVELLSCPGETSVECLGINQTVELNNVRLEPRQLAVIRFSPLLI